MIHAPVIWDFPSLSTLAGSCCAVSIFSLLFHSSFLFSLTTDWGGVLAFSPSLSHFFPSLLFSLSRSLRGKSKSVERRRGRRPRVTYFLLLLLFLLSTTTSIPRVAVVRREASLLLNAPSAAAAVQRRLVSDTRHRAI